MVFRNEPVLLSVIPSIVSRVVCVVEFFVDLAASGESFHYVNIQAVFSKGLDRISSSSIPPFVTALD